MRILHAASEYQGLAKTGGLADVVTALTTTLHRNGHDVRICLPAYRDTREQLIQPIVVTKMRARGHRITIIEGQLQSDGPLLWLVDCPPLFDRPGTPYGSDNDSEYSDNALRFAVFGEIVSRLALGVTGWRAEVVHLHDWHSGLAALQLSHHPARPRVIFTVHNLAHQGLFKRTTFDSLELPAESWRLDGVEFHGQLSFMKAGLVYSDIITTVSPNYASEIQTEAFGCGLDGLLRHYSDKLVGIVNGIDVGQWNPATDPLVDANYDGGSIAAYKAANKRMIQRDLGLAQQNVPMLLFLGRLAHQKGADLVLDAWQRLGKWQPQLVILGCGEAELETNCRQLAVAAPDRVAVHTAVDETLAHRLTAAADLQVMPSRFEPCGLTQMYAQRYGTIPIAHRTGGLADTIVDTNAASLTDGSATGILFDTPDVHSLVKGMVRGMMLLEAPCAKSQVRRNGMNRDFSWHRPAMKYEALYRGDLTLH